MIRQEYELNLIPYVSPLVKVNVSQYDRGSRELAFKFVKGDTPFSIPSDASVKIQGLKGDDNAFEYAMTVSGNEAVIALQEQMTAVAGQVVCQIVLTKEDGSLLGTANFMLSVEPSPMDEDAITSETDIPALNVLINGGETEGQVLSWNGKGAEWIDPTTGGSTHVDTTEHWNAQPQLVARKDHIYVYSDYLNIDGKNVPAIKIGDGTSYLIDMPFVSGNNDVLSAHIEDNVRHITAEERALWNSKVTCFVSQADPTNLVFTTEREEDYNNG